MKMYFPLNMVIFHCYVSLPEDRGFVSFRECSKYLVLVDGMHSMKLTANRHGKMVVGR